MAQKKYVSLDKLTKYDELIKNKIATDDATTLTSAKKYADGLASNYDAAGTAATAESNAKSYTDTQVSALKNGDVKANADAIAAINNADTGILAQAKAYANEQDADIDSRVSALEELTTGGEGSIAEQISTAVSSEADNRKAADDAIKASIGTVAEGKTVVQMISDAQTAAEKVANDNNTAMDARVKAIENDYLKAADKTELQGKIDAKVAQTAYDTKMSALDQKDEALATEDTRLAGLIATNTQAITDEAATARAAEQALDGRLDKVEEFFVTAEGETLDTALDTLIEIQKYVTSEGAAADEMVKDIAANKTAIEKEVTDRGTAVANVQSQIDDINTELATMATSETVTNLTTRVTAAEGNIGTLQTDLDAAEVKIGALETASATHALKTEVETVASDLSDYETAHAGDYTNAQVDAKVKVATDAIAAIKDDANVDSFADVVTELAKKQNTIPANTYDAYGSASAAQSAAKTYTDNAIAALDVSDVAVAGEYVSAVSETDGKISVTRTALPDYSNTYDAKGAAAAALTSAQSYADQAEADAVTSANAYTDGKIAEFVEVSEEEITALFA